MKAFPIALFLMSILANTNSGWTQDEAETRPAPDASTIDETQWKKLDESVKRGLAWLATQQRTDGSFETLDLGQPAITSFCVMAFLAQGESPTGGKYKQELTEAIDYIMAQQKPNGLISLYAPRASPIPRGTVDDGATWNQMPTKIGIAAVYNHAISGLALCEAYGQCTPEQAEQLAPVIEKAIEATLEMQRWGGKIKRDIGGWRYLNHLYALRPDESTVGKPQNGRYPKNDSDLSVTGWQLMFLRSAKNAGFDVPTKSIDAAVGYVQRCFLTREDRRVHGYLTETKRACTRAMAGAGVLAMAHAGRHDAEETLESGEWILKHDFGEYNANQAVYNHPWLPDRYHYSAVICSQAMYQLGGKYWDKFFPPMVNAMLTHQRGDGSWPPDKHEPQFGTCYSTSLCILSLSVPNQMLPIFQR